jgi:hypothetical protein
LTAGDITACIPIGLFAMIAHGGSVLAMGVGAVSFAQIVKASEPVFAAVVGLLLPPVDLKPFLAYAMLIPIVGGVGLACVKEGKGIDINVEAFVYASIANAAAALKGKLGGSVTKALKADKSKNMDSANVYAVMNIISRGPRRTVDEDGRQVILVARQLVRVGHCVSRCAASVYSEVLRCKTLNKYNKYSNTLMEVPCPERDKGRVNCEKPALFT